VAGLGEPEWRRDRRRAAQAWLAAHDLPTTRDESWRYTRVADVVAALERAVPAPPAPRLVPAIIDALAGDLGGVRVVFVDGRFDPAASRLGDGRDGVAAGPFSLGFGATGPDGAAAPPPDGFVALNDAAGGDGVAVDVSGGVELEAPIHVVHVVAHAGDAPTSAQPSTMVRVGPAGHARLVESYVGTGASGLTNAVTVIDVGEGASLGYHRVQDEGAEAVHVGHVTIGAERDARVHVTSFHLGAAVARVAVDVTLAGDGAEVELDGLSVPATGHHHDQVVRVDHAASHGRSVERFKAVVADRAHAAFTGHVIVGRGTVDTTAAQTSASLLLGPTARTDTRPWLEILADDVRCTHGATVGRLDDDALFYLRSRGLPLDEARRLLVEAFVAELVDAVEPPSLADHLRGRLASITAARS
jgi:Fe-S cluster assembly protein SufD